ncbi:MAG: winged helix-turn-helix domain-containing protein [Treponema sp.]|nr:winged helix-turn-helix domain-containing protein [Treponema sp.]
MVGSNFIYEKIVNDISQQLVEGRLGGGNKLPSLRVLSARYGCSVSVAMQAYSILEAQGKIYSIEKAGVLCSSSCRCSASDS